MLMFDLTAVDASVAKVWSLSADDVMDDEVELVDDDALLEQDDLKKPDPASLRGEFRLGSDTWALLQMTDQ